MKKMRVPQLKWHPLKLVLFDPHKHFGVKPLVDFLGIEYVWEGQVPEDFEEYEDDCAMRKFLVATKDGDISCATYYGYEEGEAFESIRNCDVCFWAYPVWKNTVAEDRDGNTKNLH